ncbi:MAG: thiamine-phosphate kinase [Nitrososphaerota archaeon]
MSNKISDLGESWLLKFIIDRISKIEDSILIPGDDAFDFICHGRIICSGDMLVEHTDIPPGMTLRQAGRKAIVAVISDLAAKGAHPRYIVTQLGLRRDMMIDEFIELWTGLEDACNEYRVKIVGGDTNESNELVISVFGIGFSEKPIPRTGARPGDIVATTGQFGTTYTGLHALFNSITDKKWDRLRQSVLYPRAKLSEGITIARLGLATSSIDSSDGLAASLQQLSQASNVGFMIDKLPIDPLAAEYAYRYGLDVFDAVMFGGEEYELVVTLPESAIDKVNAELSKIGSRLIPIGTTTEKKELNVAWQGSIRKVISGGWEHFTSKGLDRKRIISDSLNRATTHQK